MALHIIASAAPPAGSSASTAVRTPTFNRDIAPIIFANCSSCHHEGEVAPFALMSYADVKKHAKEIVDLTTDRQMPPWKAAHDYGHFVGERRLSDDQIATIANWAKAGKPEGDAAELPPAPTFGTGWEHGQPDLIVKLPQPFKLPADGKDVFRVFVIPLNLDHDVYVSAVDFRPSNPKIVHHALFFLDTSGRGRELEEEARVQEGAAHQAGYMRTGGPGFVPAGGLGGWAPGYRPQFLPDGIGRPIKKGADLVIQIHFHPSGKAEAERSVIGIYLTKRLPDKVLVTTAHGAHIDIPAGDNNYQTVGNFVVPFNVQVAGVIPHAHLLCKEIQVNATLPDGRDLPLIWIKDWDWNWQEQYQYQEPLDIPRGTQVHMRFRYDNSAQNPRNPTIPPREVKFGEQTSDEMALVFFQLLLDRSTAEQAEGVRGFVQRFVQQNARGRGGRGQEAPPEPQGRGRN
ncbi:MAG TPA: cytochrome c [Humisphaera sp.]|nr:cytochrome c [Humisphaera sp.]